LLASAALGETIKVWDTATWKAGENTPLSTVPAPKLSVRHIDFTPDSKWLLGPGPDGLVEVRNARTGQERQPGQGHRGPVWTVAVSPDGRTIASGGADRTIRLWDLAGWKPGDPQPPSRILTGHTGTIHSIAFSPDGKLVASRSDDGTIRLWNAVTGASVRELARDMKAPVSDVAFSADGKLLATGDEDGSVRLWDVATGEKQSPLRWHTQSVSSVAFSPDGRFLASAGSQDRKVHVTDLRTFRRVQTLGPSGAAGTVMKVAFAGAGRTLAYGGGDGTIRLWDLVEKKETVLTRAPSALAGLAVDPTGRFVAATGGGAVWFWNKSAPNRPVVIGPGPFGAGARRVAFTPEGRYLLVTGANGTVSILRTPVAQTLPASLTSAEVVNRLRAALEADPGDADLAQVPLTKADAAAARALVWNAHAARIRNERADEMKTRVIRDDKLEMPFTYRTFGTKPKDGWSLYISLHGSVGTVPGNAQQWALQQKMYTLDEGIYLAPRAPTAPWNLWHEPHIDRMLARLIEDLIVFEGVNPNRVYMLGYAAGGDGVYQLAPRMADSWAAAGMMGGHPNGVSVLSLRNVPFALQVGANDAAYNRNKVGKEYGELLGALQKDDPKGYEHFVKLHEGKGSWMNLEDKVALPWMAQFTRNPVPDRVVWKQTGTPHDRSYWLAVPPGTAKMDALVVAKRDGQTVEVVAAEGVSKLLIRFDDRMVDLDKPVRVTHAGKELFTGKLPRTVGVMIRTLVGRGDPDLVFDAEVEVDLPGLAPKEPEIRRLDARPPAEQIEEVRKELKRRNPGFDGTLTHKIENGAVTELAFSVEHVSDLAPVRALTHLQVLVCRATVSKGQIADLSPLRGLRLRRLDLMHNNKVADLSPLQGMPLEYLDVWQWCGTDLTPLKGMPLKSLNCGGGHQKLDLSPLAELPLDFLCLNWTQVTDLSPLAKVPLNRLLCSNTPVSDLTPLRDTKITFLSIFKTQVKDLSPLKGLPLTGLECEDAPVTDLSPLKELPLKALRCSFVPERDTEILRSIRTLERINDKPAGAFWKSVEKK
jgi:WD40 repeat protein/poly(3-hydroxybutyrate) depolymerase